MFSRCPGDGEVLRCVHGTSSLVACHRHPSMRCLFVQPACGQPPAVRDLVHCLDERTVPLVDPSVDVVCRAAAVERQCHRRPSHYVAAQDPLGLAGADLAIGRQAPRMLDHPVIEQRHARFERVGHAGPIHLGQDVARQVGAEIRELHPLHLASESGVEPGRLQPSGTAAFPRNQLRIQRPVRDEPGIDLVESLERHHLSQHVQLVSEQTGTPARRRKRRQPIPGPRPERSQHASRRLSRPSG